MQKNSYPDPLAPALAGVSEAKSGPGPIRNRGRAVLARAGGADSTHDLAMIGAWRCMLFFVLHRFPIHSVRDTSQLAAD